MAQRKSDIRKPKLRTGPIFWAALVFVLQGILSATLYFKYCALPPSVFLEFNGDGNLATRVLVPLPAEFSNGKEVIATLPYHRGFFSSNAFLLTPDDCLTRVVINGVEQKSPKLPYCNYQAPVRLDFTSNFKVGSNAMRFWIDNKGGRGALDIRALPSEALINLLLGIWICSLGLMAALLSAARLQAWFRTLARVTPRRTSRVRR